MAYLTDTASRKSARWRAASATACGENTTDRESESDIAVPMVRVSAIRSKAGPPEQFYQQRFRSFESANVN